MTTPSAGPLRPGQAVHVNARSAWLPALILTHTPTAVRVRIATPRGWVVRAVAPWTVRPADGHRLRAVHQLRPGDRVAAADGTGHTIATRPCRGRDGRWHLTYTDGQAAALPAATILRLSTSASHSPAIPVQHIH